MKKIKVAMLAPYLLGSEHNGPAGYINNLAHYLSCRDDVEVHWITLSKESKQFQRGNLNIHLVQKVFKFPPIGVLPHTWSLKRKIIEIEPDMVHAIQIPYSITAALVRNRYPTLLTRLGIGEKELKFSRGIQLIFNILVHTPIRMYVVSRIPNIVVEAQSIKDMQSNTTKSKIYVIPSGIEVEKIQEIRPHNLNEKLDIFIVSRLVKIKGIDILIKALPIVIESIPDLSVNIAGSGPQENELKVLIKRLNLEDHIKFLGFISEERKIQYYKACKIFVVPSRWDCQPITLFEAAASGKPVIASDMSNPGIVADGKTGFIFESENVEDLADKIITLLKDEKLREEIGKAAKEKAKQYDWSKIAERTVEIYKEIIADFHKRKAKK